MTEVYFSSHGCEWAADNMARLMKQEGLAAEVVRKPSPCGLKVVVGFYQRGEEAEITAASRRVVWWVGTDILWMEAAANRGQKIAWLNHNVHEHWAEWKLSADRLAALGLQNIRIVPMPTRRRYRPLPLPAEFTVGVYCYNSRQDFYGFDTVMKAAGMTPEIKWLIYPRYKKDVGLRGNIEMLPRIKPDNMEEVYRRMSVHVRLVRADGMPQGPMEAMMCGRPVIYNIRQMPFSIWDSENGRGGLPSAEKLAWRVRQVRDRQATGEGMELAAAAYWREFNDPAKLAREIKRIMKDEL